MSTKVTPILIVLVLLLGTAAFLARQQRIGGSAQSASARGSQVLTLDIASVQAVRVQRSFWNTFVLARQTDGVWRLTEPVDEAAAPDAVRRLLDQLADLPAIEVIDLPSDDSERHREYGLWQPAIEITVTTADDRHVLLVGGPTPDGASYYASVVGSDEVQTIPAASVDVLGAELSSYRHEARLVGEAAAGS